MHVKNTFCCLISILYIKNYICEQKHEKPPFIYCNHNSTYYVIRQPAPVDKIIFLRARAAQKKRNEAAILVSSEAGTLIFWSIHGAFHNQGKFFF